MVAEGAAPGQITLDLWPAGQGRIDVAQNGVNRRVVRLPHRDSTSARGARCSVAAGVPVTLTASLNRTATLTDAQTLKTPDYPVADPAFVRWTVFGCDGTGPCTYTPEDGDWVGAIFTPLELEVGVIGYGIVVDAVDVDALSCDDTVVFLNAITTCHGLYAADSSVVLEATPGMDDPGPTTWRGGCDPDAGNPSSPRCTVTMSNIRTFAVVGFPGDTRFPFPFSIRPRRVSLGGSGTGRVTGTGVDCGSQCTNSSLQYQSPVTLNAAPYPGSHFVGWQGVCSTNPVCSFDAGSATRVKAIFDLSKCYDVSDATAPAHRHHHRRVQAEASERRRATHRRSSSRRRDARRRPPAFATLRLVRDGRALATTHWNLRTGRTLARLRVPRTLIPGRARLQVRVVAGNAVRTSPPRSRSDAERRWRTAATGPGG